MHVYIEGSEHGHQSCVKKVLLCGRLRAFLYRQSNQSNPRRWIYSACSCLYACPEATEVGEANRKLHDPTSALRASGMSFHTMPICPKPNSNISPQHTYLKPSRGYSSSVKRKLEKRPGAVGAAAGCRGRLQLRRALAFRVLGFS